LKSFIVSFLLFFLASNCWAQLRIQPSIGLSQIYYYNKEQSTEFEKINSIFFPHFGLSLNYKRLNNQFELGANLAPLATAVLNSKEGSGFGIATFYREYSFTYYHKIKELELFRKYIDRKTGLPYTIHYPKEKFYLMVFDVHPFVGVNLQHLPLTKSLEPDSLDYATNDFNTALTSNWRLKISDAIVNPLGYSLQLGVKFQFKNKSKDLLALSFCYTQGFVNLLNTKWEYRNSKKEDFKVVANSFSKGSYLNMNFSFPITIIKNKLPDYYLQQQKERR
jgi:hypothetical protein